MKLKALFVAALLLAPATLAFAQTATSVPSAVVVTEPTAIAPAVVVPATPTVVEAVKEEAWWGKLANQVITAVSGILGTAATIIIGFGVQYVRNKSALARIAISAGLVERLENGAIGIINSEAEKLKQRIGAPDDVNDPAVRQVITANATPRVAEAFKDSLKTLGVDKRTQVEDFVLGRVAKAVDPKKPEIPAVMARS